MQYEERKGAETGCGSRDTNEDQSPELTVNEAIEEFLESDFEINASNAA